MLILNLIMAFMLYNCQKYDQMQMGLSLSTHKNPSAKYEPLKSPLPRFCVVLFHSPESDASQTNTVKKVLEKKFKEYVTVIQIKSIEGLREIDLKQNNLIEEVHREILLTLADRLELKSSKEDIDLPIHIFSYGKNNIVYDILEESFSVFNLLYSIKTIYILDIGPYNHQSKQDDANHALNDTQDALDYISFLNAKSNIDIE